MATVSVVFTPGALWPASTAVPELLVVNGTNNPVVGYAFDAFTDEQVFTEAFYLPNYGASAPTFTALVDFYSRTSQTSGSAVFEVAIQAETPGDAQAVDTDGFGTAATATQAINGTAKGPTRATITSIANDSAAAGDKVVARLRRLGTNGSDTLTGDAIVTGLTIQYSDV